MAKRAIQFRFSGGSKEAQEQAYKTAAKKVVEVTRETKKNIRLLVVEAIKEGLSPDELAKTIIPLVGLTSAQGQAVSKFRDKLDESGLTEEKIDEQVERYADKLLSSRGENIARTEILDALNDGQDASWQQAQDEGLLSENATKEILLSPDACEICVGIARESGAVPIGDSFSEDGPPFHPRCGCTIVISRP